MDRHTAHDDGPEDNTAIICDGCQRAYHVGCMVCPRAKEQAQQAILQETEWLCRECQAWRADHKQVDALVHHYVLRWADSAEDQQVVQGDNTLVDKLQRYADKVQATRQQEQTQASQGRNKYERASSKLDNLQKQGDYGDGEAQRYHTTMGEECRKQLQVDPHPMNPHTYIQPTGRHEVYVSAPQA